METSFINAAMTQTVVDLRNEIRLAVDRFERPDSMAFTKETLAAVCAALDYDVDHDNFPPTSQMRAGILWKVGVLDEDNPAEADRPFRKAELERIADMLTNE